MEWTGKPKRLERVFATHGFPVYFVTAVTAGRLPLLANEDAHAALRDHARKNADLDRAMGRYVLMPDHLHFMVRLSPDARLADYVRLLRQKITLGLQAAGRVEPDAHVWQPGFFDRLLRTAERTSHAWDYMMANPLQAGLVRATEDWPFQGEIVSIRF